jgi:hypothetical protein
VASVWCVFVLCCVFGVCFCGVCGMCVVLCDMRVCGVVCVECGVVLCGVYVCVVLCGVVLCVWCRVVCVL